MQDAPAAARWLLTAGLLFVLPLVFDRGFTEQFSYPKLALAEILLLSAFAPAVAVFVEKERIGSIFRQMMPAFVFCNAVLLACANAAKPAFSLQQAPYLLCGPAWLCIALLLCPDGEDSVRAMARLAALAGTVMAGIAVTQWMGFDPIVAGGAHVNWGGMVPRMRLYATLGNPNFVAGYLVAAVFLTLALAATAGTGRERMAWSSATGIVLLAIAGTRSYGAWVGLACALPVAAWIWKHHDLRKRSAKAHVPRGTSRPVKGGIAAAAGLFASIAILAASGRATPILRSVESRMDGRIYLWRVAWPLFGLHPWLGNGPGAVQLQFLDLQARFIAAHPQAAPFWSNVIQLHNDPLQLLLECGLFGFAAFAWILFGYGRSLRQALASSPFATRRAWLAASAGGVTAILADSVFNFQFAIAPTWILLFTLLAFPFLLTGQTESARRVAASGSAGKFLARFLKPLATPLAIACAVAGMTLVLRLVVAERMYATGMRYEDGEGYALAEGTYRDGLRLDALNGRMRFGLARALYLQNRLPEALHQAELAEDTFSDSHLEVLKARMQDDMGLGGPALASYRRALWLDPTLTSVQADIFRLEK